MPRRILVALGIALAVLGAACTPRIKPTTAEKGIATAETWVELEGFGTKIKIPHNWEFARREAMVASFAREARGAWVIAGTQDRADAKQQLALGVRELKIELGEVKDPPRDVVLNGIVFARQDFESARVDGKPAHVIVLAADSPPKGRGIIVFIGYAHTSDYAVGAELREAITSLSPG